MFAADERHANISAGFIAALQEQLSLTFLADGSGDLAGTVGPEDVFHYIYAVLHSRGYRERYDKFLRKDFPRVPLTGDLGLFRTLAGRGRELVALHLLDSPLLAHPITHYPVPGPNVVEPRHPRYVAPGEAPPEGGEPLEQGRVYISRDQYFEGVPPEVGDFHIGGYRLCDRWLRDRQGRTLSHGDLSHYERIFVAVKETIRVMDEIDVAIPAWPLV